MIDIDVVQEVHVSIPRRELANIANALTDATENSRELLEIHLAGFGETTKKNKYVADLYRSEIAESERLTCCLKNLLI